MSLFYQLTEEVIRREAAGQEIIKLHIGSTNLATPKAAVEAAVGYLRNSRSGYGSAAGQQAFLQALAEREKRSVSEIAVGPGSKQLLFALASVSKRRRFVTAAPYWPAYELIAKQLGMEFVAMPCKLEEQWRLPDFNSSNDDFIVLANPGNPTSCLVESVSFARWIERAKGNGGMVVVDEAYRGIAFREQPQWPAIRLRSFSKEFNMEGFRVGYVVSEPDLIKQLVAFNQITITCVPPFVQCAAEACLLDERELLAEHQQIWRRRIAVLAAGLKRLGFEFVEPDSGMFIFARHPSIANSNDFTLGLLEHGVSVSPGLGFGDYPQFLRLSASEEPEKLERACEIIGKYLTLDQ